jgi:hypothetical protein
LERSPDVLATRLLSHQSNANYAPISCEIGAPPILYAQRAHASDAIDPFATANDEKSHYVWRSGDGPESLREPFESLAMG